MNHTQLSEQDKQFLAGVKQAMHLAFITHLQRGGKAILEPVKSAAEGEPTHRIVHQDFTDAEIRELFLKYANQWIPHREEVTAGYLNILLGGAAA